MGEVSNNYNFFNHIERLLKNNVLSHAYLIELNNYEEDYLDVLKFVKLILCPNNVDNVNKLDCDKCNICTLIDKNTYPDLYIIEPDGNVIKKEQIISLENEYSNYSLLNNKRIYIIKEADKMNDYSANTILKFLEEPQEDIIAILLTKNRYRMIDTILSRCQIMSLKNSQSLRNIDDIKLFFKYLVSNDELFISYDEIINHLFVDDNGKINKSIIKDFFIDLSIVLIDYYNNSSNISTDIADILDKTTKYKIFSYICIIEEEIGKLEFNINSKIWLDSLFSKFIGGNYD